MPQMDPQEPIPGAAAIILAGGKSSRMGRPKALLSFGGEPLVAHLVRSLKQSFDKIIVVAAPEQELPDLPVTLVRDDLPFRGPVGGIYYGLKAAAEEVAFVTSCDAPFLNRSLISFLTARISHYDVVVPYWQGRFQPLHAVYRTKAVPLLAEQLERNELRPVALFDRVRTLRIHEDEIRRFDPGGRSFINVNTPEDYQAALQIWNRGKETRRQGEGSYTVELFGVARLLAKTREIALELPHPTCLSDICGALGARYPVLVGRVVTADGRSLTPGYACNINGVDFIRDSKAPVKSGDRIFIISADAGG